MKQFIKKAIIAVGGAKYLRLNNRVPRVIFWHGVDKLVDHRIEAESFEIANFKKQIVYLTKNYEIISIDDFYSRYTRNTFSGKEIVLTFDDGYRNNLTTVAPMMREFKLPFTVFVSTNNIYSGELFPTSIARLIVYGALLDFIKIPSLGYEFDISTIQQKISAERFISNMIKTLPFPQVQLICSDLINNISIEDFELLKLKYKSVLPMNWDEVRSLTKDFDCTIGSHCMDHICCHGGQDQATLETQIVDSKEIIEKEIGRECKYFAYPNGDFTDLTNQIVENAGYKMGFSTKKVKINSTTGNISAVPRLGAPQFIEDFKIFINRYPK